MSSFVLISPEVVTAASSDLTGIGSAIRSATRGGGGLDDIGFGRGAG